jgi:lipopolysaccharide/colanic/teichoic acid biosynthesis glycosyltransferase
MRVPDLALKRGLDVVMSAASLSLLAPPFAAIGIAIKVDSRGPVFYRGVRVGRHGRSFRLFKFRSMIVDPGIGATTTSENDPRITRVGRLLRTYKLDELPQLINVLLGDMSLVGPRPEVQRYVDLYTDEEKAILSVRPGITDWSSIKFHNEGEIVAASGIADPDEAYSKLIRPEKLRLQLKYVRERNLVVDLHILFETLATLVRTRAHSEGTANRSARAAGTAAPSQKPAEVLA